MKKNIVLIEDSNFVRSLLKHALTNRGFEVYEADEGRKILHAKRFNPSISEPGLLDKIKVDLFLLDIELDDMSGLDVLKKLKEHADFKNIPVIVNSSHSDKETIVKAISSGAIDYILKTDNFVKLVTDKVSKLFETELSMFEAALTREVDWVRYGEKELSFAIITLQEGDANEAANDDKFEKIITKIKENVRHCDGVLPVDKRSIAIILPLTTKEDVSVLKPKLSEILSKLDEELKVKIGISHYPSDALLAEELIAIAKAQAN